MEHLSEDVLTHKCDEFIQDSTGAGAAFTSPYNLTGSGIGVAVVDSGAGSMAVSAPPDVSGRTVNGPNFAPGSNGIISPGTYTDTCGHGTHVAGIIAGNGQMSSGTAFKRHFNGVARSAKIIGVRVLDNTGAGTVGNVISGIPWCVLNKSTYNIRVINFSLGHDVGESYTMDPLCQAVESAWNAGIVVVCAAGNTRSANTVATNGMDNEAGARHTDRFNRLETTPSSSPSAR